MVPLRGLLNLCVGGNIHTQSCSECRMIEICLLSRSFHQDCSIMPTLYILVLNNFLHKLRMNLVLVLPLWPGRYHQHGCWWHLYTCNKQCKDCGDQKTNQIVYKKVTGTIINPNKSVSLQLGSWRDSSLYGAFSWMDVHSKTVDI